MQRLRDEGKIRFIALSESSGGDVQHAMMRHAVLDGCWDVIMTSFNLFNQSARDEVFPGTIENDIAVEIMASARSQFSQPELLVAEMDRLVELGQLDAGQINRKDPMDFLHSGDREVSLTEASYRLAAHEKGVHVVLVGTGKIAHLEENVVALNRGPLPEEIGNRLIAMFGHLREEVHVPGRVIGPA
jgi:aryl-alcohol dehydrogenase-like predicted oxidoreductase